jgi:hypothetical protein
MDRLTVKDGFAKELYRVGVKRTVDSVSNLLTHPTQRGMSNLDSLGNWYRGLNVVERSFAEQLIRESAIMSTFGLAVMFDGGAGPLEIADTYATPVVMISFTEDLEEADRDTDAIHICPTLRGEELHDLFLDVVDANTSS